MKYIRYIKKWKIITFVTFILVAPGCLLTPNPYGFGNAVISFIICLAISVGPLIPDYLYLKTPANKLWGRWASVDGIQAERRKERARIGELTPMHIDTELNYGFFSGSHGGVYRTTLCKCSCPDFQKRKVPCKHMYYLADKCNI